MKKETNLLKLNGIIALAFQMLLVINGLILPKLFIGYYGSEMNGLMSTITQYLSLISFLDMGVGAVVQSTLYKPLYEGDVFRVNSILYEAKVYFNKVALALIFYIIFLCFYLTAVIETNIEWTFIVLAVIVLSLSLFSQYYFGIVYQILLIADQRGFILDTLQIFVLLANLLISFTLIKAGYGILAVKFASFIVYLTKPVVLYFYTKKRYKINFNFIPDSYRKKTYIQQKWSGMAQHIAYTVQNSIDIVVLSIFSSLENISVYSVYNSVVMGIRLLINAITNGMRPFFGRLLSENRNDLDEYFDKVEWLLHNVTTFLFSLTAILITPFVVLYTSGVQDINYTQPIFGYVLTLAYAVYCIRLPYQMIVFAASHFKQTEKSSIIEVVINVLFSIILVNHYGMVGVAIGTLISMVYRTIYLVIYLKNNIIFRKLYLFLKIILVDFINVILLTGALYFIKFEYNNFSEWFIAALFIALLMIIIMIIVNFIFYKNFTLLFLKNKLL